jgi:hypothetical protein
VRKGGAMAAEVAVQGRHCANESLLLSLPALGAFIATSVPIKADEDRVYDLRRPKIRIEIRYERTDIDAARPQFRC